jgi:hypothetical protein
LSASMCSLRSLRLMRSGVEMEPQRTQGTQGFDPRTFKPTRLRKVDPFALLSKVYSGSERCGLGERCVRHIGLRSTFGTESPFVSPKPTGFSFRKRASRNGRKGRNASERRCGSLTSGTYATSNGSCGATIPTSEGTQTNPPGGWVSTLSIGLLPSRLGAFGVGDAFGS